MQKKFVYSFLIAIFIFNFQILAQSKENLIESEKTILIDTVDNAKNVISINLGYGFDDKNEISVLLKYILSGLEVGNQIKLINSNINNGSIKIFSDEFYDILKNKNIFLYINFIDLSDSIIWKLYDINLKKFITGKSYKKDLHKDYILARAICSDIWKELFGGQISPFDSFIVYIKKTFINGYNSEIIAINPLIKEFKNIMLSTSKKITDLSVLNTKPNSSILFSEITNKNVRLTKLCSNQKMCPIIDMPGTSTCAYHSDDGLFYIRSGFLYRYYYNKAKNKFIHELIEDGEKESTFASVMPGPGKSIICAKDYKVFIIKYEININQKLIIKEKKCITGKNKAFSATYNKENNLIITSEKIGKYQQLVSYSEHGLNRKIITKSNYHKQDPNISPCGNYVVYISNKEKNGQFIEIINLYTNKVIKITNESGSFYSPIWLLKEA
jgi:hypothetical protein